MNNDKEPEQPSIWQMVTSMLAAFAGVQSDSVLDRDDHHIDKHGFKPYIIIGIVLTFLFVALIFLTVQVVLHFAT
ncbi:MAG: DUF2970 domain-containing protein [Gammaproteobacteria bacterium]